MPYKVRVQSESDLEKSDAEVKKREKLVTRRTEHLNEEQAILVAFKENRIVAFI